MCHVSTPNSMHPHAAECSAAGLQADYLLCDGVSAVVFVLGCVQWPGAHAVSSRPESPSAFTTRAALLVAQAALVSHKTPPEYLECFRVCCGVHGA